MASLNKVQLIGNLGKDPEVRYMPAGDAVTNVELTGSRAGSSPVSPATEGSEVERRVGGAQP